MLNIYKVFILFSTIIFISKSKLTEEVKKNMKFVCGEAIVIGGRSGHIDGPGDFSKAVVEEPLPRNFTVEKSITKQDNLTMIYEGQCGVRKFNFSEPIDICDTLDSKSDDDKTNLHKAIIDLLGFNVSNCPIPTGTYTLKQQNDFNPWLSDFFGSECNKHDLTSNYGLLTLHLIDGNGLSMIPSWHQIQLNGTANCSALGSIIKKSVPDTFNPYGGFIEQLKENMKFVCGEAIVIGGGSGHIDGPGELMKALEKDPLPRNFIVKKPITKEDNFMMRYGGQCGHRMFSSPEPMNICDTMDSQSDDDKTNLYKAFIDLLGFNVSNCPIPEGTYTLKQQNDFNPWLSDFLVEECKSITVYRDYIAYLDLFGGVFLDLMKGNHSYMTPMWHKVQLNSTDNCTVLDSVMGKSTEVQLTDFLSL